MSTSDTFLEWLKIVVPGYDWNLKGDPQGIVLTDLVDSVQREVSSNMQLSELADFLFDNRMWFHLTDEEGHQIDQPTPPAHLDIWVSVRSTPWAS